MPTKLFIANDHAAVDLKKYLIKEFPEFDWQNMGTDTDASMDYPDSAIKLCKKITETPDSLGVLICGSGQGMAMTANKFSDIRAALCWTPEIAKLSREHNNANVLCLGARALEPLAAKNILSTFLETPFEGGRHERRLQKMQEANK